MKFVSKKGDLEWDQIGKVIIALVALIILIYIITQVIGGELGNQGDKIKDSVSFWVNFLGKVYKLLFDDISMIISLNDRKNNYYANLNSEELKRHHKLLESQLEDLETKEIRLRINSSINVLREMSRNRVHLNEDDFIHEDINFLKANGLMYLSEYVKRTKNAYRGRNRNKNRFYIREASAGLVNNCGVFDYVNVRSSILGLEKFALRKATHIPQPSIFSLPSGFTRTDGISTSGWESDL